MPPLEGFNFAPDYWRCHRNQRFLTLVREICQNGKTVAAICHGPWMFVSAGILKGKLALSKMVSSTQDALTACNVHCV